MDAESGFWVIQLDDESSILCTFNTPFGRHIFCRLPYGISCAPELFHKRMSELFEDIPGVLIYIDDILIHSDTVEGHNKILEAVIKKALQVNLKFNKDKCHFLLTKIKYLGNIFSEEGRLPDNSKIDAICKLPKPESVGDIKRFLGMIHYLGSFIENLASKTINLRELFKKSVAFHWTNNHQFEYDNLKTL